MDFTNFGGLAADRELLQQARLLAALLNSKACGHPLVSGLPDRIGRGVLWQYESLDFLLHYGEHRRQFPDVSRNDNSMFEIQLTSLEETLEFIRITEAVRERTAYPFVQFGRMPRTIFR